MSKLYTTKELLDIAKVSRATLYRDIEKGIITPIKLTGRTLRFTHEMVESYAKEKELTKAMKVDDNYYTIDEVSKMLKVHKTTAYRWAKEGMFHSDAKNGRIRFMKKDVDDYLKSQQG